MTNSWVVVLPAVFAIVVSLWTKRIFVGLFSGVLVGKIILTQGNPLTGLTGSFEELITVFSSNWNMKIILFATLMGGLVALLNASGGVTGLTQWLEKKFLVKNKRGAGVFVWILGVILYFDQVTSEAITGTVGQGLADKYGFSRQKLAYLVDSTASPMCALLPINSWGAYIIGLLATLGVENSIDVMAKTIPLNFYCILALLLTLVVSLKDINLGKMKMAELAWNDEGKKIIAAELMDVEDTTLNHSPATMIIPLLVLLVCVPLFLYITGEGKITSGNASTAVFWGVLVAILVALLCSKKAGLGWSQSFDAVKKGTLGMIPVAGLLVFAFALSSVCGQLELGKYIAQLTSAVLSPKVMPLLIFVTTMLISFSTGSSWGAFAIMIPIIVPIASEINSPVHILLAAMLSGAIFGDHSSIMSDSTVLASSFSGCNNIDHFETQLPYALISAAGAAVLFLVLGLVAL